MTAESYPDLAKRLVFELAKKRLEPTDQHVTFALDEVYVVSFTYICGGWKAFLSTTLPDGMYYEVTRHPSKNETYICSYKQWEHVTLPDKEQ